MKKELFPKLALDNIRKNARVYVPYIITCIATIAVYYIVKSLSLNPGLKLMTGADTLIYVMSFGCSVVAIFAFVFLFYSHSFLLKQRKKEFGVFHILGMEKKHLVKVMGYETLYVALGSLAVGIAIGVVLDKAMYLWLIQIVGLEIKLGFFIAPKAVLATVEMFAGLFFLIFCNSVRQIWRVTAVELLRAGNVGEKEPKTKWVMSLLGLGCIGCGYYLSVTTKNPVASVNVFFIAVILVIVGTYLLFTAGSIALLKALRKNKRYYYKTRHFISVSGMIYRMKQNAVGLANICILSTMVLVMVSSTSALMIGIEDAIRNRYPVDFFIKYNDPKGDAEKNIALVKKIQQEEQLPVTDEVQYNYISFTSVRDGDTFLVRRSMPMDSPVSLDSIQNLFFVTLDDYNREVGKNYTLRENEIMVYSYRQKFDCPVLKVLGKEYQVVRHLNQFIKDGMLTADIAASQFIVVPDREELIWLYEQQKTELKDIASEICLAYGFDTSASDEEQQAFYQKLQNWFHEKGYEGRIENRAQERSGFLSLYGGLFFIGIFLAVLFTMATVLIIYYKQISEGYSDRERFVVMQKVGMSADEVKAAIRSQVLTVFFLPLIVAGMHLMAAFPLIKGVLAILNLSNTRLYLACLGVCFLTFALIYVIIYGVTAKTYYQIVAVTRGSYK